MSPNSTLFGLVIISVLAFCKYLVRKIQFLNLEMLIDHELVILANFHRYRAKIVEFFQSDNFWNCPFFISQSLGVGM